MKGTVKVVVGVVSIAAVAVAAWTLSGKKTAEATKFLTAEVSRGTVVQSVATTGTLEALTTVKVGSQVSGIIAEIHADFNDRVKQGQVLAVLDPTPFVAAVNQTRAQLERARIQALDAEAKYKRQQALFEAKLVSEDQLETARAAYHQALAQVTELEAALERAETNYRYSVIRSPIDGVVVSRDYDVGQTVAASFQAPTLFTIAEDLTRMRLNCDVSEADIGQVKVGQLVLFNVDSYPEREFTGRVAQIRLSPKIANNVVTYPVVVEVENREGLLLPGMTAEVHIQVAKSEDTLRIPAAALRFRPEMLGLAVGTAGGGGTARPRRGEGGPPGGSWRAARGERPSVSEGGEEKLAVVYVPGDRPSDPLRAVRFRPGLTDGQYVEVKGGELAEGTRVVVGLATAQAEEAGGLAGMTRMGPPRR
ncbi:MAG: efflux RND transporter periplasmic adaptor subunit [Thermoanaerobaculum sp.]|nr:efflux RND transporter periplasmic adaptor subunit [Thermoanaerobaculum sp.]MDW7967165.1 efflux RND transporter periplasmic adaptor subunit [Thermoanaerobaculum sp.]